MSSNKVLTYKINVNNKLGTTDPGAKVLFFPPPGTMIQKVVTTSGSFDVNTSTWQTGPIPGLTPVSAQVYLEITNSALINGQKLRVSVNGTYAEIDPTDNIAETDVVIQGDAACPTQPVYIIKDQNCPPAKAKAYASVGGILSGNVSYNDEKCTRGETIWEVVNASEVNVSIIYFDTKTGLYFAKPIDPTLPWSFKYQISCKDDCNTCPGVVDGIYGPFNEVTVQGDPVFVCDNITGCISNSFSFVEFRNLSGSACPSSAPVEPPTPPADPQLNHIVVIIYSTCTYYLRWDGANWVNEGKQSFNASGIINVVKAVLDLNNDTTINLADTVSLNQIISVTVDDQELDHQSQALPGFESYTLSGNNVVLSIPYTGVGRVKYLKIV